MTSGPDYILALQGLSPHGGASQEQGGKSLTGRPWLAIRWRCCGVYSRVYRNAAGTAYEGRCPKCSRPLTVKVGPGGTNNRFFDAY